MKSLQITMEVAMKVTIGTFNLNNLFSRFNFQGAISQIKSGGTTGAITVRYEFTDPDNFRIRTFMGKLVKTKKKKDTEKIGPFQGRGGS